VFEKTWRFDDAMPLQDELTPSLSRLPALAIFPASVSPAWWTHELQQWPVLYDVVLWTPRWQLNLAEELIEQVIDAIYRSAPEHSTVPFVKQATGYYPQRLGPITFTRARVGPEQSLKVIETRTHLTLRATKDPWG
jgi:hypothetical protein